MENFANLATFAKVVEEKSFSGAARKLGISLPVVSKRVGELEQQLGAKLLHRTTRRLSLTEAGSMIYQHCANIVAEADAVEAAISHLYSKPRGHLRVSAPLAFGLLEIAPAVPEFLARYPEVELELVFNDRIVDLAEEGIDVALRMTSTPGPNLVARQLAEVRRVVCAAPAYLKRHGTPRNPADLAHHNCIFYSNVIPLNEWQFKGEASDEVVTVTGNYRVNSTDALRQAAVAGLGIAMLPSYTVAAELKAKRLVALLTKYALHQSGIYAVYLPNRHLSPKTRVFIDFLLERLKP
jgi:DNA-binding transcriptional LysR family regulator